MTEGRESGKRCVKSIYHRDTATYHDGDEAGGRVKHLRARVPPRLDHHPRVLETVVGEIAAEACDIKRHSARELDCERV